MLHRPVDLDTTCSLAILQEEVLGETVKKDVKRSDQSTTRSSHKHPQFNGSYSAVSNYSSSPAKATHQNTTTEDNKSPDTVRFITPHSSPNSKMAALMAFRKAKGLCYKGGLRGNANHTCVAAIPLNVVEEVWQLVQDTTIESSIPHTSANFDYGEDLCAISLAAVNGQEAPRTIMFKGRIQHLEVVVLADCGSSWNLYE